MRDHRSSPSVVVGIDGSRSPKRSTRSPGRRAYATLHNANCSLLICEPQNVV
jgi:hypothetical protein